MADIYPALKRDTEAENHQSVKASVASFLFFCVPQLYLWGSPFLGEIFAYVTVF